MEFLDNPQDKYQVIHVAGTSGKSSTCHYLSALLTAAGQKVGMTVSPHVYEVNERVQINTQPLAEAQFCRELSRFLNIIQSSGVRPTYFELLVAFAYWEFAEQGVDYAVIEVGLGGLLDGTNVVARDDKVCVITDIGFDHTSVLGKTLSEITAQKAGIILPGSAVFSYRQGGEVMQVLQEACADQQANLHELSPEPSAEIAAVLPLFQQRNWQLAHAVFEYVVRRDSLPALQNIVLAETTKTYVPARMETVVKGQKTIILDGAHNPQKLTQLVRSLRQAFPQTKTACMVSFVESKQDSLEDNLRILLPVVSHLIACDFSIVNPVRPAVDPQLIVRHCTDLDFYNHEVIPNPVEALEALLARQEAVLLIVGSLFLPETVRPLL